MSNAQKEFTNVDPIDQKILTVCALKKIFVQTDHSIPIRLSSVENRVSWFGNQIELDRKRKQTTRSLFPNPGAVT